MSDSKNSCCAAAAAAQTKQLVVGGHRVGIVNLDGILEGARVRAGEGEAAVRAELLRLVRIYNYVPSSAERDYEEALFAEFLTRFGGGPGGGGAGGAPGSRERR
ncbi:MAG: hypothetical protein QXH42_09325 [Thermoplasmata archaeon]